MTGETAAWQVLQETWLGVLKNIGQVRQGRRLPAWVYGVARRTALHHLRKRYAQETLLRDMESEPLSNDGLRNEQLLKGANKKAICHAGNEIQHDQFVGLGCRVAIAHIFANKLFKNLVDCRNHGIC